MDGRPPRPRDRLAAVLWPLAYLPLALAYTWPLAAHFSTRLGGDTGDHWQNTWNLVWIWRSLWHGENPFHTAHFWHPDGTTLVFQTFDLPDLVWAAPLSALFGPVAAFNCVVVWTFAGSGLALYLLARGTGASRAASFLAGCAYTFTTFHFGHARGHLHIQAMQWVPLFVLAFWRCLEGGRWRWAFAGGAFAALSALASWYHGLSAILIAAALAVAWLLADRGRSLRRAAPRVAVMAATGAALVAPLVLAILRERAKEPIAGAHEAWFFSADLQSFFLPNSAQLLAKWSDAHRAWTGNGAEVSGYFGYGLLLLAMAGAALKVPRTRAYVGAALVGVVLSLGPALHVGGRVVTGDVLPYEWLRRAFPLLDFTGVPVRFGFTATLGLAAALAPTLDALAVRLRSRPLLARLPYAVALLGLAEHLPHAFLTSAYPTPAPVAAWAEDGSDFAVLDACRDSRHLWHATVHGHPILGGYLTRTPARLERKLAADPVAGPLGAWHAPVRTAPFERDALDLDFAGGVVPGAEGADFVLELSATLDVPRDGAWTFYTTSDDDSELFVDGARVVDNRGEHPARERSGTVALAAGAHALRLTYRQRGGGAFLRVERAVDGAGRGLLGAPELPGGWRGTARFHRREIALEREAALSHLRALKVRYIVQDRWDSAWPLEAQLGLAPVHDADGVRIYEVPPAGPSATTPP